MNASMLQGRGLRPGSEVVSRISFRDSSRQPSARSKKRGQKKLQVVLLKLMLELQSSLARMKCLPKPDAPLTVCGKTSCNTARRKSRTRVLMKSTGAYDFRTRV